MDGCTLLIIAPYWWLHLGEVATLYMRPIGLSKSGDIVNIFNAAGVRQADVSFGVADAVSSYQPD